MRAWHWLITLPENRRWLPTLIAINLGGAVYGFLWYAPQLAASPLSRWPVIPDSPLAALYFGLALVFLALDRRQPWLEGLAFFAMVKYGLWTPIVLGSYMLHYGYDFAALHLSLSHLAMALEACLFVRYYAPSWRLAWPFWLWFVLNDVCDYWFGTHPYLPADSLLPLAQNAALALTVVSLALFGLLRRRARA